MLRRIRLLMVSNSLKQSHLEAYHFSSFFLSKKKGQIYHQVLYFQKIV